MAVSLDQLQAFVATVEQKSMAQAARHIGKHVSTLREQINNLEIDTGLTLFIRHPKSLEVTHEGKQLYNFALSMLKESAHFDAKVDSLLQGIPDKLTIAIDASLIEPALDLLIAEILKQYPYLTLKVLNGDTLQVRGWVLSGQADIGLMFSTINMPTEMIVSKGYNFEVIRVVPPQWALPPHASHRDFLDQLQLTFTFLHDIGMRNADVLSHRYMFCNNATQLLNLIKAGVGWGHLPKFVCEEALLTGDVIQNQEKDDIYPNWHADLTWLKEKAMNPAMQMFIDGVRAFPVH
ncbi:LysR family transcriptional regulator [Photobacterium sanguinicancri]|uniref:LysR family transcriptional regulator n=1 Tax=Photobacterium sanguinicancri TaxID=875932 RepID=UPI0021C28B6C|nr:LysR family transcriptional regulator [Photobacterium sanguinicancri]